MLNSFAPQNLRHFNGIDATDLYNRVVSEWGTLMLRFFFRPLRAVLRWLRKQYLFTKLQSGNYDRRFEAGYALEKGFGPSAVAGLIYLLRHENPDVRHDVAYTLEKITGKYNGEDSRAWRTWWRANRKRVIKKYYSTR